MPMSGEALDTRKNVNSIPDEVLVVIFYLSRDKSIDPGATRGMFVRDEAKVSHVCHHWRSVSIDTPLLWTSFRCLHPEWNAGCLPRSRVLRFELARRTVCCLRLFGSIDLSRTHACLLRFTSYIGEARTSFLILHVYFIIHSCSIVVTRIR
jgi:hypothetical protein